MNFNGFLDRTLINTKNIDITVYLLIIAILIIVSTYILVFILKKIFNRYVLKKHIDIGRGHAIFQIIKYLIWVGAITMVLETLKIKVTFLLASSAALLVGLGLGLQEIFREIFSGIVILFEGSLKVDDVVQLENGIVGKVKQIGLRVSYIETRDNIILIIPNTKFVNENVINWSHHEKLTRFYVSVGVAYGSDVRKIENLLVQCAIDHKDVSTKQKPFVMFTDFGESSLDFKLYFWTSESFWVERIKSELRFAINDIFIKNGIQIPFPQRDLHIKNKENTTS